MDVATLKRRAWNWISEIEPRMIQLSDRIWGLAELGLQEFKSSQSLSELLQEFGFTVERGVAGLPTAFVASYGSGHPVVGVMGEFDALPGLSQKPVPRREPLSEGAPGHGCGHNVHGVSGAFGAIAAKTQMEKDRVGGTVKFFGCPGEEAYEGKVFMVRAGLFSDVDAALSHHPGTMNVAPLASSNALNTVKFHFHGIASHAGNSPEMGRSALDAVELMNIGVNYLREHLSEKTRIHYVIQDGGLQPNIVPSYARSWYFIRAPTRDQVEGIYDRVLKIADAADLMSGTTHQTELLTGCYNMLPNRRLSELVTANMREVGAPSYSEEELIFADAISKTISIETKEESLRHSGHPDWQKLTEVALDRKILDAWDEGKVETSSTDVADVSWVTPAMEFYTQTFILGTNLHSWQAVAQAGMGIGHRSLVFASKTIVGTVLDLLTKPDLLSEVRSEFKQKTKGRQYVSPIPPEIDPPLGAAREQRRSLEDKQT